MFPACLPTGRCLASRVRKRHARVVAIRPGPLDRHGETGKVLPETFLLPRSTLRPGKNPGPTLTLFYPGSGSFATTVFCWPMLLIQCSAGSDLFSGVMFLSQKYSRKLNIYIMCNQINRLYVLYNVLPYLVIILCYGICCFPRTKLIGLSIVIIIVKLLLYSTCILANPNSKS